jgi:hypothetical protein
MAGHTQEEAECKNCKVVYNFKTQQCEYTQPPEEVTGFPPGPCGDCEPCENTECSEPATRFSCEEDEEVICGEGGERYLAVKRHCEECRCRVDPQTGQVTNACFHKGELGRWSLNAQGCYYDTEPECSNDCINEECELPPAEGGRIQEARAGGLDPIVRYRCSESSRRRCGGGYTGEYIERNCEKCFCYKHSGETRGLTCRDSFGHTVDPDDFPFRSTEECLDSCKSEKCRPVGRYTKTFECKCVDSEKCTLASEELGIKVSKQACNCTQCYCEIENGVRVCRDPYGNLIGSGEEICRRSLPDCLETCGDSECPTWTRWGCYESKGNTCNEPPPTEEIVTDCVECRCSEGGTALSPKIDCVPVGNMPEKSATLRSSPCEFISREECEESRRSPYGSCKGYLCSNNQIASTVRGISTLAEFRIQTIPPTNLGIRKSTKLNAGVLGSRGIGAATVVENLQNESIYDLRYNFTTHGFDRDNIALIYNGIYPKIFSEKISSIVAYFLVHRDGTAWDEVHINELRGDYSHIIESLNPDLNLIFNNLTYPTGRKINPNNFYEGLIELLITGKLEEFDFNYFEDLYAYQSRTEVIEYEKDPTNDELNSKVALGIIAESIVPADPEERAFDIDKREDDFAWNTKAFLTDVSAHVPVIGSDGVSYALDARDSGLPITLADGTTHILYEGSGHGTYFPIEIPTDSGGSKIVALEPNTSLASTYFTPIDALAQAAHLLDEDTIMRLSVSSAASEFDSDYVPIGTTSSMYLSLDLSSLSGTTSTDNPLVNNIKCSYTLMNDLDEIKQHSIGAGTLATEIFFHIEDPIATYLSGSGKCELDLINIDFTAFVGNKAPMGEQIIARGIVPRALIIQPATGSRYTPFHTKSKIEKIYRDGDGAVKAIRSCDLVPYMDTSKEETKHALTRKHTFVEHKTFGLGPIGTLKSKHRGGEYDVDRSYFEYETSAVAGNYYFSGGTYTSSVPDIPDPPTTKLVNDIIGTLKSNYKYTHFTWWDIFRRLKLFDFGRLQLEITDEVLKALQEGEVTGGVPITHVLSGKNESNTGITNPELDVSGDTIYLTEFDRRSEEEREI